jgi:hypothetical protein
MEYTMVLLREYLIVAMMVEEMGEKMVLNLVLLLVVKKD